jgi:[ribosomal protein S5]-alanine N-acetyltransferase
MSIQRPLPIFLRALEVDDYKTTIRWRADEEIWDSVLGERYFVSSEYERKWIQDAIANRNEVRLGVCLRDNSELIGLTSIVAIDWLHRSARSQIMIGEKSYWGKGYGTQAVLETVRFGFLSRGFERMWVRVISSNEASIALHEKIGYKREGVMRHAVFKNGRFHDVVLLSLLRDEFEALNAQA